MTTEDIKAMLPEDVQKLADERLTALTRQDNITIEISSYRFREYDPEWSARIKSKGSNMFPRDSESGDHDSPVAALLDAACIYQSLLDEEARREELPAAGSAEHLRQYIALGGTSGKADDPYTDEEMGL
jgi:hypothetical protein